MSPKKDKKKTEEESSEEKTKKIEEKEETVSVKKVVYAEIDDEVTVLADKIKSVTGRQVYIVVPKRAILFQSIVNLKILKRKAADDKKKIYLVTNDKNGVHLAQKTGIEVYNEANSEGKPALFSTEVDDERLRITPLLATVNAVEEEAPTRLKEKKISISEILKKKKGKKGDVGISKIRPFKSDSEKRKKKADKPKFVIVAPNKHALIGLVAVSLAILLFIVYIALPGATIYLTPAASVLERSVNITLADAERNRALLDTRPAHTIASHSISMDVERKVSHSATGKRFSERGANASGTITIFNTENRDWPLVAQTRFQTDEGIIFRTNSPVTVPRATTEGPGTTEIYVVADQVDAYGEVVGERGNIEPTRFFLPGLREESRTKLYAENTEPMSGGVTDFITYVSSEDIEAARNKLREELLKNSVVDLREEVEKRSRADNAEYRLLEGSRAIQTGEAQINVPPELEGSEVETFEINGTVRVSGVYYDHDSLLSILTNELLLRKSPQKELVRVNEDSLNYRIFEWDDNRGQIRMTANIKAIEQYSIDPSKPTGANFLARIQERIAGQDVEQAILYIQNLPEINKVRIESWPAWAPTVPSMSDNIKFNILSAID